MQFQIPQFIEVEDRIFGPLTFRQFIYIAGGAGASYVLYRALPIYLAGPLILGIAGLAAGLGFFQYNGRPFIIALESAFYYLIRGKLYLWNNERKLVKATAMKTVSPQNTQVYVPKLSESRLHDLAWSLDVQERIAAGTIEDRERTPNDRRPSPLRTAREARLQ